jgi:hypothetical protein
MFGKKAVSAVVATVLIILITISAVTIIWAAIIPMIQNKIAGSGDCLEASGQISINEDTTCLADNAISFTGCTASAVAIGSSKDISLTGCTTTGTAIAASTPGLAGSIGTISFSSCTSSSAVAIGSGKDISLTGCTTTGTAIAASTPGLAGSIKGKLKVGIQRLQGNFNLDSVSVKVYDNAGTSTAYENKSVAGLQANMEKIIDVTDTNFISLDKVNKVTIAPKVKVGTNVQECNMVREVMVKLCS